VLALTQSYIDPQNLGGTPWAIPGIAINGALTVIFAPRGVGSLFATMSVVDAATRGLSATTILIRKSANEFALQVAAAAQTARLEDAGTIKNQLHHHDALLSGFVLDDEGLLQLEGAARIANLVVIDNAADVLDGSTTSGPVLRRLAKIARATDTAFIVTCPLNADCEEALRDVATVALRLDRPNGTDLRVVYEKSKDLAMPEPLSLRVASERVAVCTGGEEEIPALQWIASPSFPSPVAPKPSATFPPSRANQPATCELGS
jgi:hypothetical protein